MTLKRRSDQQESKKESNIVNLENGKEYEGRLVYIADLGLQEREYKGEQKPPCQMIALGFEIIGEQVDIDGEVHPRYLWDRPFNIYHEMTDKGIELVKYKIFKATAEAGKVADWDSVLNTPVNITIKHTVSGDATYDNIGSITPIPLKYQGSIAEATITPCIGDADDPDNACTKALYGLTKWFYDKRIGAAPTKEEEVDYGKNAPAFNPDDEIPF